MFMIKNGKVVDSAGRLVGIIKDGAFTQRESDPHYKNGLRAMELEQVSEAMQKKKS